MLVEYKHKKNTYNLGPRLLNSQDNIYTVIVGKNGTGKSRLLKSIIEDFIGSSNRYGEFSRERDLFSSHENKLGFHHRPQNIIAVSTSPFDKFPLMRNRNSVKGYSYLGLRNLRAPDLGKAYMSSVFTSLVYATQGNITAGRKISEVLNYLGYEGELEGRYHLELRSTLMDNVLESHDPIQAFIETHFKRNDFIPHRINRRYFLEKDEVLSPDKIGEFISVYRKVRDRTNKPRINISISRNGAISHELSSIENDFHILINSGAMRLRDLLLHKKGSNSSFMINDASSGEQSVVMSILGIASEIKDGSLICIDEPEVCLHPEWQEKYIELLISTFKEFKSCHFIIATHSPLIVSKLKDDSCFVMSMDDGTLKPATEVNNRSVDFQLANTFKTPGYKNEFLTRVLVSLLTNFSENGELSREQVLEIRSLLELKTLISDTDPVKRLMMMAEEAIEGLY